MTKKRLQAELTKLGIGGWNTKTPKAELEALLKRAIDDVTTVANKSEPVRKAAAQAPAAHQTKRGPSTKDIIRGMFPKVGATVAHDALFEALATVKPATVSTMLGDLRNEKYAGPKGVIDIQREGDEFTRVH